MPDIDNFHPYRAGRRLAALIVAIGFAFFGKATPAAAADQIYFAATDNITNVLVARINAETVRVDISCWYLTEHAISEALINKFNSGVPVRLIGDRGSIFEIDPLTRKEFYWLASQGLPIRLRFNPTYYPEIDHWKTSIFVGQNLAAFGSANYTPFELAPASSTNYKDETVLLSDDPTIVNAIKTKFDRLWNDTTPEPESLVSNPPYFKNWNDACATEPTGNCSDYHTLYPNPVPMVISTNRLEADNPLPDDLIWGQGPDFNDRLVQTINAEGSLIQFVIYRLTVDNITQALLNQHAAGVPIHLIVEPNEYPNRTWPEFWMTHANVDKLWAAGIDVRQRAHQGLTHMKTIVTSTWATNASSNYAAGWQRDIDYFIAASAKPTIYQALSDRVTGMWNDTVNFAPFQPQPPDAPTLASPASGATSVATTAPLVWNIAPFATNFDVYLGTSPSNMTVSANVLAQMTNSPPSTYSLTPSTALQPGTTYYWKVVSRTNATPVLSTMVAASPTWSFTTAGAAGPPAAPVNPAPSNGATGVGTTPTLSWQAGAVGTTFSVAFGTANPPSTVATGLGSSSYSPGTLAANTTYFWRVTAVSSGGSTPGSVWSFTTGSNGGGGATDVVIYAADVTDIHGSWSKASDSTAAAGVKLTNPDAGVDALASPLANPTNYFDVTFQANAGTRYRLWLRIHAIADSKFNDSVFVQYSDSLDGSGNAVYRTGTTGGLNVNLWTCATCQSFGWGWQRNAYWLADTGDVWFQNSGTHTLRVQIREDGSEIDQIVLSPTTYASNAPGPVSNDNTIVPKPPTGTAPSSPGSPAPSSGATGIGFNPTLSWSASGATSYDVSFGASNPPPTVVSGQTTATYSPSTLATGTTYFWRIVARNASGSTTGPVWSFTTASAPPGTPTQPNPANGATGAGTTLTLTWTSTAATSYDVLLGTNDPPVEVATGITTASYTATGLAAGTEYLWEIVAHNAAGTNQGPEWTFTTAATPPPPSNVVIYASDVPPSALHGAWVKASDPTSPNGITLLTPDNGVASTDAPPSTPVHYVDVTFTAQANTPYRLWLRMKALNNSKFNDSLWVQFSDALASGSAIYPMNSTSALDVNLATDAGASSLNGWGWQNTAYWLSQPTTLTFATSGTHTMRIQVREDGASVDQIVLSPTMYLNASPGPVTADSTIVPKP